LKVTILIVIIAIPFAICIVSSSANSAFADGMPNPAIITVNGTNYEIEFNTVNAAINTISPNFHSYIRNSLDMNITADKLHYGNITMTLTKDAIANIFCIPRSDVDRFLNGTSDYDFGAVVDNYFESITKSSAGNLASLTFIIPPGSTNASLANQFVGMAVDPLVQFKGIPDAGIYRPGQQVMLNGTLVDGCGRNLNEGNVELTADSFNVTAATEKQVPVNKNDSKFSIAFTIPKDIKSGSYNATLYGTSGDLTGSATIYFIVEKAGESNIPFSLKTDVGTYEIPYHSKQGEIIDVSPYFAGNSLSVQYYATQNGTMEILFPRELMDFVIGNIGKVTVQDNDVTYPSYPESADPLYRIFDVPIVAGRHFIDFEASKYESYAPLDRFGTQAIKLGDRYYAIPYSITDGIIQEFDADPYEKYLTVEVIRSANGGHLHLELPRNVIDSVRNGKDSHFVVTDSINTFGYGRPIAYTESQNNSSNSRILDIDFPAADRNFIEIRGSQMIPEFPFAILIFIVSIISLIAFYKIQAC